MACKGGAPQERCTSSAEQPLAELPPQSWEASRRACYSLTSSLVPSGGGKFNAHRLLRGETRGGNDSNHTEGVN